ncbi:hypothetical protein ASG01_00710 [Chryseobacterium sp. Leaf180]|uniref:fibronectin type III domain-containing protein n=1 Tax=Chryseobacterium sp. Leaf180 TaxID=1736289 RepID=UPI0006F2C279|nr:T9SS type A sorting domain-containing protein [Chryseobacterium sp. Leaf180]KQR94442.1 hypothetical protein ASG01_00710 [Chryseobacterium sp. Leaf180]
MKTKLLLAGMLCSMMSGLSVAQYYQSVPLTAAGFTDDVIANGAGLASVTTTSSIDDTGNGANFAYYSKDFQATPAPAYGLAVNGYYNSAVTSTPWLPVQLQSYSANNSLRMVAAGSTGTLTFATPTAATKVYVIGTSGSGSSSLNATVNFSDGTTQTASVTLSDWYSNNEFVVQGVGRVGRATNATEGTATNPKIYQSLITITAANQSKTITSISFAKPAVEGFANIFGISVDKYSPCMAGTSVTAPAASLGTTSAVVNWTAPSTAPTSYDVYYTTSPVVPFDSAPATVSGISATTVTLTNLNSNTVYYLWTRGSCGTTKGTWSYGTSFRTLCSAFTVPYSENFDTTATGSTTATNAPSCWNYLETSGFPGSGYVSASNANSAPNSYILANSSATTGNGMLVGPTTTALSSGLNRVKFYAKGSAANYTLEVGTVSNAADASTFTAIGSPISLTTTHSLYTVNIPAGTNLNLAFRHGLGGTSRTIYIDDVTVEAIPACVEPTGLASSNVTANSATVSWALQTPTPVSYEHYLSTANTAPTATTNPTSSDTPNGTNLTNLLNGTTYYFWVRSSCSNGSKSTWTGPVSFTTITPAPVNDVCSGAVTLTVGSSFAQNEITASNSGATTDTTSSTCAASSSVNNIWFKVVVPASGSVTVETGAATGSPFTDSVLTVFSGSCGILTQVSCNDDITSGSNIFSRVAVTGRTPGETLYVSVARYSNVGSDGPIKVSAYNANLATTETSAAKKEVSVYPNPFSDVLNISDVKDLTAVAVYDMNGRLVKTIAKPEAQLHLGELNTGLYMITLKYKDGFTKTIKAVKK